jgi:lipoprotein
MKHFLSALALGCLLLACNRDLENNENNETPAPQKEKLVLVNKLSGNTSVDFWYKNGNEIESARTDGMGKSNIDYEYDTYGRIIKERRFSYNHTQNFETNITYQYDGQGRITSSLAISSKKHPACSVERKHTYTYQGNKVTVKIEIGIDNCSSPAEAAKEKTITLFVENGKVVKSLDENNQIIETIEYHNTKNALRNIKGFPALVVEFYIRPLTYELPFYNGIEHIEDLRFIDNVKTRDLHNGNHIMYEYRTENYEVTDKDYPYKVIALDKSSSDPTQQSLVYMNERNYIEKQ